MQSFSVRPRLVLLFDSSTAERYRSLPADLHRRAFEKLAILNAAITIDNLEVPPGNRLETLRGNRTGQHSIE